MKNTQPKLSDVRQALSGKQLTVKQRMSVRGGDNTEVYPWIDNPGG